MGHSEVFGGSRDCDMKGSKDPKGSRHSPYAEENPPSWECHFVAFRVSYKSTGLWRTGFEQNWSSFCRRDIWSVICHIYMYCMLACYRVRLRYRFLMYRETFNVW